MNKVTHSEHKYHWEEYSKQFKSKAIESNLSSEYIERLLSYAKKLWDKNLPVIFDLIHISLLVGYDPDYIIRAEYNTYYFYRHFQILKKSGSYRNISEPLPSLKEIQYWILNNVIYKITPSPYVKSYLPGISIKENAKFHRNQKYVLTIDIKDFFPSITKPRVMAFFEGIGYNKTVSRHLASLCCLNDSLPQGAPTSPFLSNVICKEMDIEIGLFCKSNKIRFTRYADDMTFSGDFNPGFVILRLKTIIHKHNFTLNEQKTRVRKYHQQQEVTGIVVNKKLQISKQYRKKIRQEIYYIKKYGLIEHMKRIKMDNLIYLNKLIGKIQYVLSINPKDTEIGGYKENMIQLYNKLNYEIE